MANIIRTVIQFRRATTAEWLQYKDVVPAAGEPCFDLELGTLKIGDGVKTYAELEAIGGSDSVAVSADGSSIVLEDSVFKIAGFDAAEVGAQPRKNAEGNIEWVVPSTETVEGLQATVAGLQSDVESMQAVLFPTDLGEEPLLTRVETLEEKMDGDGEGSVNAKIASQINKFATDISNDGVVNSYKELIDYVAAHGKEAVDMAADIADLQSKVGDTSVASQIATAMSKVEVGAQVNKIESISAGGTLLEIVNKGVSIPIATKNSFGLVKGSSEITIATDGSLEVVSIGIEKIVQDEAITLIMDGGGASA